MQIDEDVLREVEAALGEIEGRLETASGYLHNSTKWVDEKLVPGVTYWDWILGPSRTALAKLRKAMEAEDG